MLDLSARWPSEADWTKALVDRPGLSVHRMHELDQLLVSGDLAAWHPGLHQGNEGDPVTPMTADAYNVRIARDRVLAVSAKPLGLSSGWYDKGYAVTRVSAAFAVLEIRGSELGWLLKRAMSPDAGLTSPSASLSFAGLNAIAYRVDMGLRLHVDRALAAFVLEWLTNRLENVSNAED